MKVVFPHTKNLCLKNSPSNDSSSSIIFLLKHEKYDSPKEALSYYRGWIIWETVD